MKANKKTLMAVKSYLENKEGWDLDELISEMVHSTKLLKHKDMGEHTLSMDECGIEWDGDNICLLEDFVESYTDKFIEGICNILDSFVDEDIDCYLYNEEE
jgi:hypothetical protein